jgi:hypothetical protein
MLFIELGRQVLIPLESSSGPLWKNTDPLHRTIKTHYGIPNIHNKLMFTIHVFIFLLFNLDICSWALKNIKTLLCVLSFMWVCVYKMLLIAIIKTIITLRHYHIRYMLSFLCFGIALGGVFIVFGLYCWQNFDCNMYSAQFLLLLCALSFIYAELSLSLSVIIRRHCELRYSSNMMWWVYLWKSYSVLMYNRRGSLFTVIGYGWFVIA